MNRSPVIIRQSEWKLAVVNWTPVIVRQSEWQLAIVDMLSYAYVWFELIFLLSFLNNN